MHKARQTAEYALFFLLHVGDVHQEIDDVPPGSPKRARMVADGSDYVSFALEQVASLIYSVHVPRDYLPAAAEARRRAGEPPPPAVPEPIAFWRDNVWERTNRMRHEREVSRPAPAVEGSPGLEAPPLDAEPSTAALDKVLACAAGLSAGLHQFLEMTQADGFEARVLAILADTRRALDRRLTFCMGVVLSLGLLLGVEAVRSLILNQGKDALLPLGLSALPLLLFLRRPARRLRIDWGRRAFVSRHTAEPDPTIVRWPLGNPFSYRMHSETLFSLGLLGSAFLLLGGGLAVDSHFGRGTSFLTIFMSLALVLVFLRLCIFLDRWDFADERPVRLRALSVGAVSSALILAEWFGLLGVFLLATGTAITWRMWQRRAPLVLVGGAVALTLLVTASALHSAHSRSANAWSDGIGVKDGDAELRHVMVESWPLDNDLNPVVLLAASGGGSRAAIYTAKTLSSLSQYLPEVAEQLQAISSVSGGSLAAAAYIARRYAGRPADDLEAAVSNDFLLPTLVGAFTPWSSRGTAIEESWRKPGLGVPAMGDLRMSHLALAWEKARREHWPLPPFPLPLLNTCALDGHDVVVTPLDRHLYTDASDERWRRLRSDYGLQPTAVPTWVVDRDAIYGLEDLLPNANVLLASAVRASANFPFGFPLVDVETCRDSLFLNPMRDIPTAEAVRRTALSVKAGVTASGCRGPATVHLTDGGVLSNSGMWSLFQLLNRPKTVEALKRRGALLVLVEASKMPEFNESDRSLLTLFGTLGDRKPVAQSLHRRMFELLHQLYGGRLAIVQLDLIPEAAPESFNVYTTWALDPKSQHRLTDSFGRVWAKAQGDIRERFQTLRAGGTVQSIDLLRPPLD